MTIIAAIQLISSNQVSENLAQCEKLIVEARRTGAYFVALPENFAFMGVHEEDKLAIKESFGTGPIQDFLSTQAKQHNIWLLGGTVPITAEKEGLVRAASLLYNPQGECALRYDKIHLFDVLVSAAEEEAYKESSTFEPGDSIQVASTDFANIGMSVCYDVRFPELYRNMHAQHVDLITVPAAFTYKTGEAHWETLLRARAVENLCYVIAPNQGGLHVNERETWGHSMIVDPWGKILDQVDSGLGIAMADIDLSLNSQLRQDFPALHHRKLNYQLET